MTDTEASDSLADRFEQHRGRLRAVGYRMLGSLSEADDAVQEAWLRLQRSDPDSIENLGGWLTTTVARVCLDLLRSRKLRGEEALESRVPDPIVSRATGMDPEEEVLLADAVGLALIVVLETLPPTERLAFILHDMFDMPFDDIAAILGRSETATRQLASRGRRRVRGASPVPDVDLVGQREVVDAFVAAVRANDLDAVLAVLHPEVVFRADRGALTGGVSRIDHGAHTVAEGALRFSHIAGRAQPALINGAAGFVAFGPNGRPVSVVGFTVRGGRIVEINMLADPERLGQLDLTVL